MKILHKGTPPGDFAWIGTCPSCNTQIVCKRSEIRDDLIKNDQRDGTWANWPCPTCKSAFGIDLLPTKDIYEEKYGK